MKLYEMQEQLIQIDNILNSNTDPETNEILESAREEVLNQIKDKIDNVCEYISDCKNRIDYFKSEEERIAAKRKTIEKRVEWLKNMLFYQMKLENKTKGDYGTYTLSIAKTPEKVVIANEDLIPDELCKFTRSVDKTAIKNAMTDGQLVIDGCVVANLQSGETLRIK